MDAPQSEFDSKPEIEVWIRLMIGEDLDAASAGHRVGYSDASHFTREYKRLFGAPPMRDVERLREAATVSASP
jgi:AraC-like DNA-binding protein